MQIPFYSTFYRFAPINTYGSNFHFVFFCINNVKSYDGSEIYTTCKFMHQPDKDSRLQGQRQRTLLFSAVAEVRISIPFSCAGFQSPYTQRKKTFFK